MSNKNINHLSINIPASLLLHLSPATTNININVIIEEINESLSSEAGSDKRRCLFGFIIDDKQVMIWVVNDAIAASFVDRKYSQPLPHPLNSFSYPISASRFIECIYSNSNDADAVIATLTESIVKSLKSIFKSKYNRRRGIIIELTSSNHTIEALDSLVKAFESRSVKFRAIYCSSIQFLECKIANLSTDDQFDQFKYELEVDNKTNALKKNNLLLDMIYKSVRSKSSYPPVILAMQSFPERHTRISIDIDSKSVIEYGTINTFDIVFFCITDDDIDELNNQSPYQINKDLCLITTHYFTEEIASKLAKVHKEVPSECMESCTDDAMMIAERNANTRYSYEKNDCKDYHYEQEEELKDERISSTYAGDKYRLLYSVSKVESKQSASAPYLFEKNQSYQSQTHNDNTVKEKYTTPQQRLQLQQLQQQQQQQQQQQHIACGYVYWDLINAPPQARDKVIDILKTILKLLYEFFQCDSNTRYVEKFILLSNANSLQDIVTTQQVDDLTSLGFTVVEYDSKYDPESAIRKSIYDLVASGASSDDQPSLCFISNAVICNDIFVSTTLEGYQNVLLIRNVDNKSKELNTFTSNSFTWNEILHYNDDNLVENIQQKKQVISSMSIPDYYYNAHAMHRTPTASASPSASSMTTSSASASPSTSTCDIRFGSPFSMSKWMVDNNLNILSKKTSIGNISRQSSVSSDKADQESSVVSVDLRILSAVKYIKRFYLNQSLEAAPAFKDLSYAEKVAAELNASDYVLNRDQLRHISLKVNDDEKFYSVHISGPNNKYERSELVKKFETVAQQLETNRSLFNLVLWDRPHADGFIDSVPLKDYEDKYKALADIQVLDDKQTIQCEVLAINSMNLKFMMSWISSLHPRQENISVVRSSNSVGNSYKDSSIREIQRKFAVFIDIKVNTLRSIEGVSAVSDDNSYKLAIKVWGFGTYLDMALEAITTMYGKQAPIFQSLPPQQPHYLQQQQYYGQMPQSPSSKWEKRQLPGIGDHLSISPSSQQSYSLVTGSSGSTGSYSGDKTIKSKYFFKDHESGVFFLSFKDEIKTYFNKKLHVSIQDIENEDIANNSVANSSASAGSSSIGKQSPVRLPTLKINITGPAAAVNDSRQYLEQLNPKILERFHIFFPQVDACKYKELDKHKTNYDQQLKESRSKYNFANQDPLLIPDGIVSIRIKPPLHYRGVSQMKLPTDVTVTICGPNLTNEQRVNLTAIERFFSLIPTGYISAIFELSPTIQLGKELIVRNARDDFIAEHKLVGLRWLNDFVSNSTNLLKVWSKTSKSMQDITKVLTNHGAILLKDKGASLVTQENIQQYLRNIQLPPINPLTGSSLSIVTSGAPGAPGIATMKDVVTGDAGSKGSTTQTAVSTTTSTSTSAPMSLEKRYVIHWPMQSCRYIFLGERQKQELADILNQHRVKGLQITSPHRDKHDLLACILLEGDNEALVNSSGNEITDYLNVISRSMCHIKLIMSDKQRERLIGADLVKLKEIQGKNGVYIQLDPRQQEVHDAISCIDFRLPYQDNMRDTSFASPTTPSFTSLFHDASWGLEDAINSDPTVIKVSVLNKPTYTNTTVSVVTTDNSCAVWTWGCNTILMIIDKDTDITLTTDELAQLATGNVLTYIEPFTGRRMFKVDINTDKRTSRTQDGTVEAKDLTPELKRELYSKSLIRGIMKADSLNVSELAILGPDDDFLLQYRDSSGNNCLQNLTLQTTIDAIANLPFQSLKQVTCIELRARVSDEPTRGTAASLSQSNKIIASSNLVASSKSQMGFTLLALMAQSMKQRIHQHHHSIKLLSINMPLPPNYDAETIGMLEVPGKARGPSIITGLSDGLLQSVQDLITIMKT